MKAFLKAKKNSDMSTIKPTNTAEELTIINKFFRQEVKVPSTKITVEEKIGTTFKNMETTNINTVQIENSPEELAIINKFFRQEVKVPSTKIAGEEKIETTFKNLETANINTAQIENTPEELAIINKFFKQEVKVPSTKITAEEKIKTSFENLQISEVTNAEEEKIIQRFFPRVKENLRENLALADNSSNFLDAFITKNKAKKNRSIVAVLDTTNPQLEIDKAAEIAVVERFFPSVTKSKEQEEIAVQFDVDKVLNEVSKESEKRSAAEVEIINKFFKSEIKKKKVLLPKPLNLNLFPVEIVPQNNKKEQAIINKFFGGKFQNTIAKSRTVQGLSTHTKEEDIRLYNKFFGKNIPVKQSVKQSKKCCS